MPSTSEAAGHPPGTQTDSAPLGTLVGGIAALIVAMGIGRFAYTPILPSMQRAEHLSTAFFGFLGSVALIGYLVGAIVAATWFAAAKGRRRLALIRWAVAGVVLTTAGMGASGSPLIWIALRGLSGVASSFVFILASGVVLDWAAAHGKWTWVGIYYSGVGLGIALSGILTPPFLRLGGWQAAWFGFGLLSLGLALLPWLLMREHPSIGRADAVAPQPARRTGILPWAVATYSLEGLGYIVTGTFLVAMLDASPHLRAVGTDAWTIVGLAAAPSSWLWSRAAGRVGALTALVGAFALQTVGVLLPVALPSVLSAVVGAALFGGTFMGITTLSVSVARAEAGESAGKLVGWMTALYSIGQVIGPTAAGLLVDATGGYAAPLAGSATVLLTACGLLLLGRRRTRKTQRVSLASTE